MPITVQSLSKWEKSGINGLLSIVIPAHNEEGDIEKTIANAQVVLDRENIEYEILVINDNSSDSTEEILQRLTSDRVCYLNNEPPHGFGYAIRLGLAEFRGDCVIIMMADGSDEPEDLVKFYRSFEAGFDCVFGTRFSRDSTVVGYPLPKIILNRLGNHIIRFLFLMRYNDTTNAFKLYSRHVIAGLHPLLAYGFNLTVELPLKSITRGYSHTVLPNNWYNRRRGLSKFKIDEVAGGYLFIIFYCWLERRLSNKSQIDHGQHQDKHLQVWHR